MWGFYSKTDKYLIDPGTELGLFRMFGGIAAMIDNNRYIPSDKININIYSMDHYDITIKYKLNLVTKLDEDFDTEAVAIRTNNKNAYYTLSIANYSEIQFEAIMEGFEKVSDLMGLKSKPLLIYKGQTYELRLYRDFKLDESLILKSRRSYKLRMPKFNDLFPLFYLGVIRCLNDYPPLVNKTSEWYLRLNNLCHLVYGCKFTISVGEVPSGEPIREFCRGYISCYRLLIKNDAMSCNVMTDKSIIKIKVR